MLVVEAETKVEPEKKSTTEQIKKTIGESELAKRGKAQKKAAQEKADAKQAKKPEPKPVVLSDNNYAILNGKKISYDVDIEDTGETVSYTEDAGDAMRSIDDRIEKLEALKACIG